MTRARTPRPHEIHAAASDPRLLRARTARPDDPVWRSQGRCRTVDPETFFPMPTEPADMALALCRGCDVQAACLAAALNAGDVEGVYGATTPRERRAMLPGWRNSSGTAPAPPVLLPLPIPRPTVDRQPAPDLCVNRHEQNTKTRGIRSDGRPYCRVCTSNAGTKGGAVQRAQWAAGRAEQRQAAS